MARHYAINIIHKDEEEICTIFSHATIRQESGNSFSCADILFTEINKILNDNEVPFMVDTKQNLFVLKNHVICSLTRSVDKIDTQVVCSFYLVIKHPGKEFAKIIEQTV